MTQISVKAGIGSSQRTLKRRDGILDVVRLDSIAIDLVKGMDVLLRTFQLRDNFRPARSHFQLRLDGSVDLAFQSCRPAIPELTKVERAIEDRGRVDSTHSAID